MTILGGVTKFLFPLGAACALAGCGGNDENQRTFATDTEDKSGGELIVTEQDPNAIQVNTPDTPMTNVPPGQTPTTTPTVSPSPSPLPSPTETAE